MDTDLQGTFSYVHFIDEETEVLSSNGTMRGSGQLCTQVRFSPDWMLTAQCPGYPHGQLFYAQESC
jgi:hypothetical protein